MVRMQERDLAIGVFDSGVGGLTVLRALQERLPFEQTVYLGDTARVPYGTRSQAVVTRYAIGNARFLMERRIKLLVVACNTVSAESLPALRDAVPVPVIGVVEPGAAVAARVAGGRGIGVIGTPGTIASGAYVRAIAALDSSLRVTSRACPLFVPLAEEGWTDGEVPTLVAAHYLHPFQGEGIGTLVLGCTHYPILRDPIARALPGVALVDSAAATADAVEGELSRRGLLRPAGTVRHAAFVTDLPASFHRVAERFLGRKLEHIEQTDISV
jgi:glutamate racemase